MHLIRNALHPARELRHISHQAAIRIATCRPAVVEDDVVVAQVAEAVVDDFLGGGEE